MVTLGKTECSSLGLSGDSQYDRCAQKMVLERLFVGDTGEDSALHIQSSGLLGNRTSARIQSSIIQ